MLGYYGLIHWQQILSLLNQQTDLFSNVNPSKDHWLSAGAGISGLSYTMIITQSNIRIELTISTSIKDQNKLYFKKLLKNKQSIEQSFGNSLVWEELPDNKMSRVKFELQEVNIFNESDWEGMNDFFLQYLPKFENSFLPYIKTLNSNLKVHYQ